MDPSISRTTWRALEPYHAMAYFAPEPQEEYAAVRLDNQQNRAAGYFPARAAAMGAVSPGVVQATFFNFSPLAVAVGMAGAWDKTSPGELSAARYRGADRALRRLCGDQLESTATAEAADLARSACEACTPYGRPLYGANAGLDWPEEPHMVLWHAITLLREYRGDGHIAALVTDGFTGLESAVTHVAQGDLWNKDALRTTRGYSEEEWQACVQDQQQRGLLDQDEQFTDQGRARRQHVEDATDRLALPPWERLGEAACERLRKAVAPLVKAIADGGGFPLSR